MIAAKDRFAFTAIAASHAMNYSIATADRTTHLKIVVVALLWAILASGAVIALA